MSADSEGWVADDSGILSGGTVGGDGAMESVSIRLVNSDYPNSYITSYWYVYDKEDRNEPTEDGKYGVENMTEFYTHEEGDPEDEVYRDYQYDVYTSFKSLKRAEQFRDKRIQEEAEFPYVSWDGGPLTERYSVWSHMLDKRFDIGSHLA